MSQVLVIGINYAPENIGTGKYTTEMCEWLVSRGHTVRVICGMPYYPEWKARPRYKGRGFHKEHIKGVDVVRCPIWVPEKPTGCKRMLHLASYGVTSGLALACTYNWRADWIINIAPTLASAPGALLLAKLTGARTWLHLQDFEVDAAVDMGIVESGWFRSIALKTERAFLRRFNVVSTIAPKMVERLAAKGVADGRCFLFPNWVDTSHIMPLSEPSVYRSELGIPQQAVVAMYSGNMGLKQGMELLAEAANRLVDEPNLYFIFAGHGPARKQLEAACGGLKNVRFLDLQPATRLKDWLGLADIHLLPQRADVADLVMPSKLTGMLASGRAILATAYPGTGLASVVQDIGLVTPPGDVPAFVEAIRRLASERGLRLALGAAARAHAEAALSREAVLNCFESRLTAAM